MPGTNQPQHGIQGLSAKLQEFTRRLTSLETWQRTMSVPASPWTAPTLLNSWVNFGGTAEAAGYFKDPFGFVHIRGSITGGASGTVAFTLPVGFRPAADAQYSAVGPGPSTAWVAIQALGNVTPFFSTAGFLSMSGITFLAEN